MWLRQWPINSCTSPMIIQKATPFDETWLKRLDIQLNETNQLKFNKSPQSY